MDFRVLGCSSDITRGENTTCFGLDEDVLLDAGTGLGELTLEEMARVRRIFITHSHLDHIGMLPLMIDSIFEQIQQPLIVHSQEATLQALRDHVFNWILWPDFPQLPDPDRPVVDLRPMAPEQEVDLGRDRTIRMLPAHHAVPACGYQIRTSRSSVVYSGDLTTNDCFWDSVNALERVDHLIVECAFADRLDWLAETSRHYAPRLLADDLTKLRHDPVVWISHRQSAEKQRILDECRTRVPDRDIRALEGDLRLAFP
jgi:ribonuclease BN (tRNA processing enzyme)